MRQRGQPDMSHPSPSARPGNPRNPRAFFDVDIGSERGGGRGFGPRGGVGRGAAEGKGARRERGGARRQHGPRGPCAPPLALRSPGAELRRCRGHPEGGRGPAGPRGQAEPPQAAQRAAAARHGPGAAICSPPGWRRRGWRCRWRCWKGWARGRGWDKKQQRRVAGLCLEAWVCGARVGAVLPPKHRCPALKGEEGEVVRFVLAASRLIAFPC